MSTRPPRTPKYRHYKPKDLAVVRIDGKDVYLGRHDSPESWERYHRRIAEWLAGHGTPPAEEEEPDLTVVEVMARYMRFARKYYRKEGRPTSQVGETKRSIRAVCKLYGRTPAREFGPKRLNVVRQAMVDSGVLSRQVINERIARIKRAFKWAVAEELVPGAVFQALTAVEGLRKNRTTAHDPSPVQRVDDAVIEETSQHLPQVVADMVRFQRLTGCRPAEVCLVRPRDVDTSGQVWIYRPESHKTEHHGRDRIICVGPRAQDVLRAYLLRDKETYCFSPQDSEKRRRAKLHEQRRVPLSCGNRPGTNRKRRPKRRPGDRYTTNSYRRVIHRAVALANKKREEDGVEETLPKWSPNQARHSAATEIRKEFGLEAAQVTLGHAMADVTQVYAQRDLQLAEQVALKLG